MTEITLTVMPHHEDALHYMACWSDGEVAVHHIPEVWLDLIPFMVARTLLAWGYDASRLLVVRLEGADYDLLRATIGAAAATPLVNSAAPVKQATQCVFQGRRDHGC
jgi:hypothetical protein